MYETKREDSLKDSIANFYLANFTVTVKEEQCGGSVD